MRGDGHHQAAGRELRTLGQRGRGGGAEPFLTCKSLRGDERLRVDVVENPEIAHCIPGKLFALAYESTRRIFVTIPGKAMISCVSEDTGSQEDLVISPAHAREHLLPGMRRMIELVRGAVDNRPTLRFGAPDAVRHEVVDNLRILGAGGGCILGLFHNLQAVSPVGNVAAMYRPGWSWDRGSRGKGAGFGPAGG